MSGRVYAPTHTKPDVFLRHGTYVCIRHLQQIQTMLGAPHTHIGHLMEPRDGNLAYL